MCKRELWLYFFPGLALTYDVQKFSIMAVIDEGDNIPDSRYPIHNSSFWRMTCIKSRILTLKTGVYYKVYLTTTLYDIMTYYMPSLRGVLHRIMCHAGVAFKQGLVHFYKLPSFLLHVFLSIINQFCA